MLHRKSSVEEAPVIRDLGDFCTAWPKLEVWVSDDMFGQSEIPEETRSTIRWLRTLADRVCVIDPDA